MIYFVLGKCSSLWLLRVSESTELEGQLAGFCELRCLETRKACSGYSVIIKAGTSNGCDSVRNSRKWRSRTESRCAKCKCQHADGRNKK